MLFAQRQGSTLCSDDEFVRAVRIAHQSGLNCKFVQQRSDEEDFLEADDLDATMLDAANRFMMSIVTNTELSFQPEETCDSECSEFGYN